MSFRTAFKLASKNSLRWYPGHMEKGIKQIQKRVRYVDCIVEVHDARIPFSGRNPELHRSIGCGDFKPRILVLNKRDLADSNEQQRVEKVLREQEDLQHIVFTNCRHQQCPGARKLVPLAKELVRSSERHNRSDSKDINMMIVGVPNVGKSSLLNVLRNRHLHKKAASPVGATPGITRSVMQRIKISEDPLVYVIDTPGILEPRVEDDEMALKLALVGCLPDHTAGEEQLADYLLFWMNKNCRYEYVPLMGLAQPCDDISEALYSFAVKFGLLRKAKMPNGTTQVLPDFNAAARRFLNHFRRGDLGTVNLDSSEQKK